MKQNPHFKSLPALLLTFCLLLSLLSGCAELPVPAPEPAPETPEQSALPVYTGEPVTEINGNVPYFTEEDLTEEAFETYGRLDALGRCTGALANVCIELMPTEPRESISHIKPTGWHSVTYDHITDGQSLYNRCHLIGFQLTGENDNECNLITGTRYLNVTGMLPYENLVNDYAERTGLHVLYRVTPIFVEDELVARGVLMEGLSVEDKGAGVCFNVYAFNVQPGVEIDYATGESRAVPTESADPSEPQQTYILNTGSHKFHRPDCSGVASMKPENRQEYTGTRSDLIAQGYKPCGSCKP